MSAAFLLIILLSLALAVFSKRGHLHQKAEDFFIASGQFGAVLFFFLGVGETYSITSVLGYPGGVYANGTGFVTWFLGYILLAFVVGYFLNPLIWRAGRIHNAITLPDLFRRHFDSRGLEVTVALVGLLFLVPLGMQQFLGLQIVLKGLGWGVSPLILFVLAALLAFIYIAISGIRASAYVAILKDILLILAILTIALAASLANGTASATSLKQITPTTSGDVFSITTILLQSVGFCMVPNACAYVFTRALGLGDPARPDHHAAAYMLMFRLSHPDRLVRAQPWRACRLRQRDISRRWRGCCCLRLWSGWFWPARRWRRWWCSPAYVWRSVPSSRAIWCRDWATGSNGNGRKR